MKQQITETWIITDLICRICPYCFDLLDMFGDCASAKPKMMSTEYLDLLEEEKSEFNNDDDMIDEENGEQELDDEINETSFAYDMSSIVTVATIGDSHKKISSSVSLCIKKKPQMISLVNNAQSAATTAYAQSKSCPPEVKISTIQ